MGANNKKLTTAEFIEKARTVHGARYDYSQSKYEGKEKPITIACPEHGGFTQRAGDHVRGKGCRKCSFNYPWTTALFITKARAAHGDRYDYSQSEYVGANKALLIICPVHGVFRKSPSSHINGKGCPRCAFEQMGAAFSGNTSEFVAKAQARFGNKYDYSLCDYVSINVHVKIICREHGVFEQTPNNHLHSLYGCRHCASEAGIAAQTNSTQQFIERARATHGNKYDYSVVQYKRALDAVIIICPQHGSFKQVAAAHIAKSGCPECARDAYKLHWVDRAGGRPASLYFLRVFSEQEEFYKVGISYYSVKDRYAGKDAMPHYKYEVLALYSSPNAGAIYDWEQSILESFAHLRYQPKQHFGGDSECFSSCEEILAIFPVAG
jgi:hypothetical protein